MKIIAKRGDSTFIVELNKNKYYLVSTNEMAAHKKPLDSDMPDTFLKFGYFEEYEPNEADEKEVIAILKKWDILNE